MFRGVHDIMRIFNDLEGVDCVDTLQQHIDSANAQAKPIWDDLEAPFSMRLARCQLILDPVVNQIAEAGSWRRSAVPASIGDRLDQIFHRHYNQDNLSLIGCADSSAYEVQDGYARDVVSLLRATNTGYAARAMVVLGKVYGSTAIPLLSISSVSALWNLVNSAFYKKQLSLVSLVSQLVGCLTDACTRYIDG